MLTLTQPPRLPSSQAETTEEKIIGNSDPALNLTFQTVFEGLLHIFLADLRRAFDIECREPVTGLRNVALVTGCSVGVSGQGGVRWLLPDVILVNFSRVQNTSAQAGGMVTFLTS